MRNPNDHHTLIPTITIAEAQRLKHDGIINTGMIPKIDACISALKGGVKKAHIIDARLEHALLLEIFTDRGIGTQLLHQ